MNLTVDLGDPDTYDAGAPYELWERMRATGPVHRSVSRRLGTEFWSVIAHREIRSMLGDDEAFVSRYGVFLGFGPQAPDPAGQRMLVVTDGPHRRALRSAMHGFFSPGWARRYRDAMVTEFHTHLSGRVGGERFDFAQQVAWRVPMFVTCRILGLPEADRDRMCTLANGVLTREGAGATAARAEIFAYFRTLVAARAAEPGDDVVSALLADLTDGPLPADDIVLNLLSLLVAANETTRLALTGAVVAFAEHPLQWERLCGSPELAAQAVDEVLRWTSPGLNVSRTAARQIVLGGVTIPAGDVVTAWLPAGNRDPEIYHRPYEFDIGRRNGSHVTLGHGPHHCIGAALARVEISALLEVLTAHVRRIEITGPPVRLH
jgi:hydroxylation protein CepL